MNTFIVKKMDITNYYFAANKIMMANAPALGIVAVSFFEAREKDIADSPTRRVTPKFLF